MVQGVPSGNLTQDGASLEKQWPSAQGIFRANPKRLHTPLCLSFLLPVLSNFRWAIGPNHPNQPHCTTQFFVIEQIQNDKPVFT